MELKRHYPKLAKKLNEEAIELRHVLSIDENYFDYDSEEFEYDPEEYNYIVYVAQPLQTLLGKEGMDAMAAYLQSHDEIEDFLRGEEDLFALKTERDAAFLADVMLSFAQERVCEAS